MELDCFNKGFLGLGGRVSNQTKGQPSIVISASFAVDPVIRALDFWSTYLDEPLGAEIAPYAQIYQQLLDPVSVLRTNAYNAAVLCVRWSDFGADDAAQVRAAVELSEAVKTARYPGRMLILLCPDVDMTGAAASQAMVQYLADEGYVTLINAADAFKHYSVTDTFDAAAEKIGHVPYTEEAFAVLGTTIARWRLAHSRKPIKLIASDCDNTLWGGVVGEDGVENIIIGPGHLALQKELSAQAGAGRIVGLLSKNEEQDVLNVFATRADMGLSMDKVLAHKINWDPKAANVADMAGAFGIGLDTVVFLDDSALECAEMRARQPEVMTVHVPANAALFEDFVTHLWLFDMPPATNEDKRRTEMYHEEAARHKAQQSVGSLASFIDSLGIETDIALANDDDFARLAQLTQRTNQFNINLKRLHETKLRAMLNAPNTYHYAVSVCDRFGDYGVVGQMRASRQVACLNIDLFMLSCRALGRGVEHQMLAELGKLACSNNLNEVAIDFRKGPRNSPAALFLKSALGLSEAPLEDTVITAPAADVAAIVFDPQAVEASDAAESTSDTQTMVSSTMTDRGALFERIAMEFKSADAILAAMNAVIRSRPDLSVGYTAPAEGLENDLAAIWREVLQIEKIGAYDNFNDLGGKSIDLVRVHGAIRNRLRIELDLTTLFQHGTVALLAEHLAGNQKTDNAAADRASKMRTARRRAASRAEALGAMRR